MCIETLTRKLCGTLSVVRVFFKRGMTLYSLFEERKINEVEIISLCPKRFSNLSFYNSTVFTRTTLDNPKDRYDYLSHLPYRSPQILLLERLRGVQCPYNFYLLFLHELMNSNKFLDLFSSPRY